MTRRPTRLSGGLVPHPPSMWCTYESRTVPYKPTEHVATCTNCSSRDHARCVCPSPRRGGGR